MKTERLPKVTTSDARFRAGLDAVVIRASTNLGRLLRFEKLACFAEGHFAEHAFRCDRPAVAILFSYKEKKAWPACDLCAPRLLRDDNYVLLAQAPLSKETSS